MTSEHRPLPWDSKFFGFSVGEVVVDAAEISDVPEITNVVKRWRHKLTYLILKNSSPEVVSELRLCGYYYESKKTLVAETADLANETDLKMVEHIPSAEVVRLAEAAGDFSRYKLDPDMPKRTMEKMYGIWVEKAALPGSGEKLFVLERNDEPQAIVTVKCGVQPPSIGLLAVSPSKRNTGLGKCLLDFAKSEAYRKGHLTLSVQTQGVNLAAMRLYLKNGFSVSRSEEIFHVWQK